MKGDFTRDSFDPIKDFTRVMMQQGRPQLDADWNEQVAIFWEYWRNFTADVLGPHAGPKRRCGFRIWGGGDLSGAPEPPMTEEEQRQLRDLLKGQGDFVIGEGSYYVDGVRCSNPKFVTYCSQPGLPGVAELENKNQRFLVYLDVWERHITRIEDENMREVALIGTDTCSRAQRVWQVRVLELEAEEKGVVKKIDNTWVREEWRQIVHHWQPKHRGRLRARAGRGTEQPSLEPAVVSPSSSYRGPSNQLYRVEIHKPGSFAEGHRPTFKFSRENGSIVYPVTGVADPVVKLSHVGRDAVSSLRDGDWVELVDDDYVLQNRAEPLRQVEHVDSSKLQVTLKGEATSTVGDDPTKHPLLRRWDHRQGDPKRGGLELYEGAALVKETEDKFWWTLENGVQIQFRKSDPHNHYRTGDYWLIPARVATGDVVWPRHRGEPESLGPRGVDHHYAPLAIVWFNTKEELETKSDCRLKFELETEY